MTRYISADQLAERFSVDKSTVWRWVSARMLPEPVYLGPQVTRWRIDAIEAFEHEREAIKENPQTKRAERAAAVSVQIRAKKKAEREATS